PKMSAACHFFSQRLAAALRAISARLLADSFSALALPPFWPPRRPRATAAGFFPSSAVLSGGASPGAISAMSLASWLGSRGRLGLLERVGMPLTWACEGASVNGAGFQTETLPPPADYARAAI